MASPAILKHAPARAHRQQPVMKGDRSHAPADHYNPAQNEVTDLNVRLTALRRAVPLLQRTVAGGHHGILSACAALVAYLPAHALGLGQSFWSAITAIAVVQTEFRATESTARDQFLGAAIGGITGVGASLAHGQGLLIYCMAVVFAMAACWVVNVATAGRLAGITATIILLVPHIDTAQRMFLSRVSEVGWGVCSAIGTVWLAARFPSRSIGR
ncbi:MAG TPA: FUSC family protein [Steroidobacteraceae bacterium]|nr:FUSC family protein [Steroidobacteraceae bacterium]